MTANEIKQIALVHFAKNGYEGASLSQIAKDVGIKKQSIYTHFNGKDDLYLHLCKETYEREVIFVSEFINKHTKESISTFLYTFLVDCTKRYEEDIHAKFWIRNAIYPPRHLNEEIMEYVYNYLDRIEALFLPILDLAQKNGDINKEIKIDQAVTAFLGVVDGVLIELLYGGQERMERRLSASWTIYWHGLWNVREDRIK
jgi:AcrR family transcriptional regulator